MPWSQDSKLLHTCRSNIASETGKLIPKPQPIIRITDTFIYLYSPKDIFQNRHLQMTDGGQLRHFADSPIKVTG
eukprot:m.192753 g.192753  ORF g.192753 m.192753 type:complete len:74 (-) comp15661_c0_seq2:560-781(-)